MREKYCWLVADKPNKQGDNSACVNSDGHTMSRPRFFLSNFKQGFLKQDQLYFQISTKDVCVQARVRE
jgi:hypothetical protein